MKPCLVLIADATRARIFSLEPTDAPRQKRALVELMDLVNAEHQALNRELFSDGSYGSRSHGGCAPRDSTIDHREHQDEDHQRKFARRVTTELQSLAESRRVARVVLVAPARMLGHLRAEGMNAVAKDFVLVEDIADITKLTPPQMLSHLERAELIPSPAG